MKRAIAFLVIIAAAMLASCAKQDTADAPKPANAADSAAAPQPGGPPHVVVHLADGSKVPGTIVASTQADMVVDGDDGIERKIPVTQVKSWIIASRRVSPPGRRRRKRPRPSRRRSRRYSRRLPPARRRPPSRQRL